MQQKWKIGSVIALKYGITSGVFFFVISLILFFFLSVELTFFFLVSMLLATEFAFAIGLFQIAFVLSLYYLGKRNAKRIIEGKSLLTVSAEFSFGVNGIIWITFLIPILINGDPGSMYFFSLFCLTMIIGMGIFTTFTIGYYIVKLTAKKMKVST